MSEFIQNHRGFYKLYHLETYERGDGWEVDIVIDAVVAEKRIRIIDEYALKWWHVPIWLRHKRWRPVLRLWGKLNKWQIIDNLRLGRLEFWARGKPVGMIYTKLNPIGQWHV